MLAFLLGGSLAFFPLCVAINVQKASKLTDISWPNSVFKILCDYLFQSSDICLGGRKAVGCRPSV